VIKRTQKVTRVNSANVLDEGLMIGGNRASDELKGKISQTRCVSKVNVGVNLACFQSFPYRPLLAPIYRWPGLKDREGSDTDYSIDIRHELVLSTRVTIGLSLTGLRGTQLSGSIIYTLVSSPRDSTRIADSG
jgi:hypothetical protein